MRAALDSGAAIVKPSARELSSIVGRDLVTEVDVLDAVQSVHANSNVGTLVVSIGSGGAFSVGPGGVTHRFRAPSVRVRSAIGAGDSMVAGIAVALSRGTQTVDAIALLTKNKNQLGIQFFEIIRMFLQLDQLLHAMRSPMGAAEHQGDVLTAARLIRKLELFPVDSGDREVGCRFTDGDGIWCVVCKTNRTEQQQTTATQDKTFHEVSPSGWVGCYLDGQIVVLAAMVVKRMLGKLR